MAWELILAGIGAVRDYVATHVLTCLVPAFFLAGAMVTFVRREAVLEHLGEQASRLKSFSLAAASAFLIAACSCTVIPVASGLFYSGAGIGVAFIILWVAPAANLLALIYTGSILGSGIVAARVAAALLMALAVGAVMSAVFGGARNPAPAQTAAGARSEAIVTGRHLIVLLLVLASLLAPNYFVRSGPYAAKVAVWAGLSLAAGAYAFRAIPRDLVQRWMRETWWFVRIIFPLLLGGVFLVGVIGKVLPEDWIRHWLGGNGIRASFLATMIGAISYFATMTEAPFVDTLMKLGMGKGPALALLLTGPGLSLPNWLAIARVFGAAKSVVYVLTIVVLGTFTGWFFGNFIL
jgi:uncharacterized membrane protein YraQ (UPF0718 family)